MPPPTGNFGGFATGQAFGQAQGNNAFGQAQGQGNAGVFSGQANGGVFPGLANGGVFPGQAMFGQQQVAQQIMPAPPAPQWPPNGFQGQGGQAMPNPFFGGQFQGQGGFQGSPPPWLNIWS